MYPDLTYVRGWYASSLGMVVQGLLLRKLIKRWLDLRGQRVLLVGYGVPWGEAWPDAQITVAMPAEFGASPWPEAGASKVCMVWEGELPFSDQQFDRILLVHTLEFADQPKALLRECWRCLKADGRVLAVLPNRTGVWCQREISPFARGRPYSVGQLTRVFQRCHFHITRTDFALFMPPTKWRRLWPLAGTFERVGEIFFTVLGGVVMVEGRKDVVGGKLVRATEKASKRVTLKPVGALYK